MAVAVAVAVAELAADDDDFLKVNEPRIVHSTQWLFRNAFSIIKLKEGLASLSTSINISKELIRVGIHKN